MKQFWTIGLLPEDEKVAPLISNERSNQYSVGAEFDVFIDVSAYGPVKEGWKAYLRSLATETGLVCSCRNVTVVVSEKSGVEGVGDGLKVVEASGVGAVEMLHRSIRGAALTERHLAVVLAPLMPPNEVLLDLVEEFAIDPMFGTVQPRFADAVSDGIWTLPDTWGGIDCPSRLPRSSISLLPRRCITPDLLSACIVIRDRLLREMEPVGETGITLELLCLIGQARRRGFRNVVLNHRVMRSCLGQEALYPAISSESRTRLGAILPEGDKVARWYNFLPQIGLERVLRGLYSSGSHSNRRLLLDCRGMSALHNGTSHATLGLLDGLHRLASNWRIEVLVSKETSEFFDIEERYPLWRLQYNGPVDTYAVAVMLNQPWWFTRVRELHEHALLIVHNMLDTISWDVLYNSDERLDILWKYIARYSDGLLYISEFTRNRFRERFQPSSSVAECVAYLSLSSEDYIDRDITQHECGEHILVFGNDYDHKDVRRTARILSDAFPFHQVVAFGIECDGIANVRGIPSGQVEHSAIQQLIADCLVMVMPSFYEGFGLPVLQGLAFGRPVVVRESDLWIELAGRMTMPGKLIIYRDTTSLIQVVGRIVNNQECDGLKQGSDLEEGYGPLSWEGCAERILTFVDKLFVDARSDRWLEREYAFRGAELMRP